VTKQLELSIADVSSWLSGLTRQLDRAIAPEHRDAISARLRAEAGGARVPLGAVMNLALLADCLCVAHLAIEADGVTDAEEVARALPLVQVAARKFFQVLPSYESFGEPELSRDELVEFLAVHRKDLGAFGGGATHWPGLALCKEIAGAARHPGLVREHERMLDRVMEVVFAGRATGAEKSARRRLRAILDVDVPVAEDPRAIAFCRPDGPDVFATVAHGSQIHDRDPLDVEAIHAEARDVFRDQLEHAITPIRHVGGHGRTMLVLGGSGSGKTHLMRAFRTMVHGERLGYVGYLQMTAEAGDYARYVLQNLVDSLERPYDAPSLMDSSLVYLSTGLAELDGVLPAAELELLRTAELDADGATKLVGTLVDRLMRTEALASCDSDLVQALLLLQRRDPAIARRVVKFLRCDGLTPYEQGLLGGLSARTQPEDPQRTLEQLASLAFHLQQAAFVLLVDQIEDTMSDAEGFKRAQRAIDVLRKLADAVPSAVVVIACLDDVYDEIRPRLSKSAVDRLEREPAPVRLTYQRSRDEIEALVGCRLEHLYDTFDVAWRDDEPLFPFVAEDVDRVTNQRARDVLAHFHAFHHECVANGRIPERVVPVAPAASSPTIVPSAVSGPTEAIPPSPVTPAPASTASALAAAAAAFASAYADLDRAWHDMRSTTIPTPDDDDAMLALVSIGLAACAVELGAPIASFVEEDRLVVRGVPGASDRLVEVCNKQAQGGHLGKQIDELRKSAGKDLTPVAIRVGEFTFGPRSGTAQKVGELLAANGLTLSIGVGELRSIAAMDMFLTAHRSHPQLAAWRAKEQPIAQLPLFRAMLAPGSGKPAPAVKPPPAPPAPTPPPAAPIEHMGAGRATTQPGQAPGPTPAAPGRAPASTMPPPGGLRLGVGATMRAEPVHVDMEQLKKHAAFLGGTGSGKTTVALNLVEQLLERGVSALLVDRKGDLAAYARRAWWDEPTGDAARDARRRALRDAIDVALYTPGESTGRPLGLPVIPSGMAAISAQERDQIAKVAAAGLGAMMGYGRGERFEKRRAILKAAIELHGTLGDATIEELRSTIGQPDPQLLAHVGNLGKHFGGLAEDLDMLWINNKNLLAAGDEVLDIGTLLRTPDGRPRLSIISTAALTDAPAIQFWVSRLLVELGRYVRANPSKELSAVAFFDEADIYIPATSSPPTKEPMFDLLRRARSGGLGVLLASQNPGDFDYGARENIETWLVGRIKEQRAIDKMRNLLGNYPNVGPRLAAQATGSFFYLSSQAPRELKADQSLMKTTQLALHEIVAIARGE
jgi:hypothetical protein